MTINLKIPDAMSELKPRITVFGVGGAGGNAVNNMIQEGLDGVEFVVANTDAQALAMSSADRRIQMGTNLTEGLGAGSQPKIGAAAAQEAQGGNTGLFGRITHGVYYRWYGWRNGNRRGACNSSALQGARNPDGCSSN